MPESFVAGFDEDGSYFPISELSDYYVGARIELYTCLAKAKEGVEFYLRFLYD